MPDVTLLRDAHRGRLAATLRREWAAGHAVWVLDHTASETRLATVANGMVSDLDLQQALATGRAVVDLPVPDDTATIVTSSGTTGPAKVLCLTRAALDASAAGAHELLGAGPDDRWLLALHLHHVAGQSVVWRAAMLGHDPIVQDNLDVDAANEAGASLVSLVPTQLHRLVAADLHLDAHVLLGGAAILPGLLEVAATHVGGVTRSYGLTETCGGCVYDGRPFDDVEVAVRDGVLALRGPVVAAGRLTPHGPVPVVDDDGWLWTNDLGSVHNGIVSVDGRADDVIITGGVNVNPALVEMVLEDHPAVTRAGVLGVPDDEWGEAVTAVLVLADVADPHRTLDPGPHPTSRPVEPIADVAPARVGTSGLAPHLRNDLGALVRAHLGAAAVPRQWEVVTELPETSLGKIARGQLPAVVADA